MNVEVIPLRYSAGRARTLRGFVIRRISDGWLYLYGFATRESAQWFASTRLSHAARHWVNDPSLVIFSLSETLSKSLLEEQR